jgi:hypothetical protein
LKASISRKDFSNWLNFGLVTRFGMTQRIT